MVQDDCMLYDEVIFARCRIMLRAGSRYFVLRNQDISISVEETSWIRCVFVYLFSNVFVGQHAVC